MPNIDLDRLFCAVLISLLGYIMSAVISACTVQVGGMGLGDDLMAALAMVMPILRSVERLVAFDNRMTDFSLFRVVLAVQGMPSLTHLGMSRL